MRALWIALNVLFSAMFLFSVAVQFNDPDPVRWMAMYGFATLACILELARNRRWSLPAGIGLIAVSWAASTGQNVHGVRISELFAEFEMKNEMVEQAREVGGLLIVALWMFVLAASALRRNSRKTPVPSHEPAQHV